MNKQTLLNWLRRQADTHRSAMERAAAIGNYDTASFHQTNAMIFDELVGQIESGRFDE